MNTDYSKDLERVLQAAAAVLDSNESVLHDFMNRPLVVFDFKTPWEHVLDGRTDALIRYLQSLTVGFSG
jgi:uncharacterized protein (DUF2384 family)